VVKSENLGITSKLPKEKREGNEFMCNKLMKYVENAQQKVFCCDVEYCDAMGRV
jgi:hypothetical protein